MVKILCGVKVIFYTIATICGQLRCTEENSVINLNFEMCG